MKRFFAGIFAIGLSILCFFLFYQINLSAPRVDVSASDPHSFSQEKLVLLTGGDIITSNDGRQCYTLTLQTDNPLCLFLPKGDRGQLWVNGQLFDDLESSEHKLCQLTNIVSPDGIYHIRILPHSRTVSHYTKAIYYGSMSEINRCISYQYMSRFFVTGLCIAVSLFSLVLFLEKKSERYLLYLACYAIMLAISTFKKQFSSLFPFTLVFSWEVIVRTGITSWQWVFIIPIHFLYYSIIKHFCNARILGKPMILFPLLFIGIGFVGSRITPFSGILVPVMYTGIYLCQLHCILQISEKQWIDKGILLISWSLTIALYSFSLAMTHGFAPVGPLGLQFILAPIHTSLYAIAFFLVSCRKFALKFQEADDLNVDLENKIKEKTQEQTIFVRSMLHNLRTPLFSLTGYTDMAITTLEQAALSPENPSSDSTLSATTQQTLRYLHKISEKSHYVKHLLEQIFMMTQMDSGQILYQKCPLRIHDILSPVKENLLLSAQKKDIQIAFDVSKEASCTGDPLYLQQVFQNIADNALQHTSSHGKIGIQLEEESSSWKISISDNGHGISPEDLPHIFDRYYSKHQGTRKSSGLGLTIAQEIILQHGGSIVAESTEGQGTSFHVYLPKDLPLESHQSPADAEKI